MVREALEVDIYDENELETLGFVTTHGTVEFKATPVWYCCGHACAVMQNLTQSHRICHVSFFAGVWGSEDSHRGPYLQA